ncbi:MAG: LPP20 family lipoprotein [Treponema sp.]|nr:LPP20 family lipoprotein [Treponema sp.]
MKKKFLLFFILFLTSFSMFSKQVKIPEWVQNYKTVYPAAEYLAQRGSGDSAEKARNDAISALSRYFQTNVSANLSTTMSSVTTGNTIDERTEIIDEVRIQSQVDFFGIEYTEPFYLKSEKKWYCVVYLNRNDAWQQLKPQIDVKKNSFIGLYKNLEKEKDYFTKMELCQKVWECGKELLVDLGYGRIIKADAEAAYQNERDMIANVPVIFEEAKQNCSMWLNIETDYNRTISNALSQVLGDFGLSVSKTQIEANYYVNVEIDENITGNDPMSIKPWISLKIISNAGKTVYSFEITAEEKSIGYSLESARKKAYPKLTKELENALKQKLNSILKL